jgi:hypothetical protein
LPILDDSGTLIGVADEYGTLIEWNLGDRLIIHPADLSQNI